MPLPPSIAFTAVAVFGELRFALNALPETFISVLQGFVSLRRIEKVRPAFTCCCGFAVAE